MYLINPNSDVRQDLPILRQVKVVKTLFVLLLRVLRLEGLVTAVLLQIVQQSQSVREPQNRRIQIFVALLYNLLDCIDGGSQQRPDLIVIVREVRVSDAHE